VSDAVAIPSVHKMSDWLAAQLRTVGVEVKQVDLGTNVMNRRTLPVPPVILGKIGSSPHKKTVLTSSPPPSSTGGTPSRRTTGAWLG
jgi:hypothetical protein